MRSHQSRVYLLTVLSILIMGFWTPAQASPISYTFYGATSAWDSATLGDINDVAFSINLVGETSAIQPLGGGVFINSVISATITLTGAAIQNLFPTSSVTGTILDPLEMYADNGSKEVGVTGPAGDPTFLIYTTAGTALDNYGLSYLNPILGVLIPGIAGFNTSIGDLTLAAAGAPDAVDITYAAPVPIPAAIWLLASGLIGLVGLRRRMRK